MRVRIDRWKMATADKSEYAYEAYVESSQVPDYARKATSHTTLLTDGEQTDWFTRWYSFPAATRPIEQAGMGVGLEKLDAWQRHEKRANARLLEIAQAVYPELASQPEWPRLWTSVQLPSDTPRHESRFVEV